MKLKTVRLSKGVFSFSYEKDGELIFVETVMHNSFAGEILTTALDIADAARLAGCTVTKSVRKVEAKG